MKRHLIGFITLIVMSVSSWAQEAILRDDHPDRYTVVKGDTLWDISQRFLQNPWMWPEIWHVNPQISNPHLIYPGDLITLIYLDGRPRLTVERGDSARTFKVDPTAVKLEPSVRVIPLSEAIPTIPLDAIDTFLSKSRVVSGAELEGAPYVLAGGSNRLVVGAGDTLYARGEFPEDIAAYGIYRRGDVFVDPDTNEVLGVQALHIGNVRLKALENDIATASVVSTNEEIRITDRLLSEEERSINSSFFPSAPNDDIVGKILAVEGGVTQVGKLDVVVINRGEREGVAVGNVFTVFKRAAETRDRITNKFVRLPEEEAGTLMVFRTFEKLSFGIVLEAEKPISTSDIIRKP
ncbi:LysM peptidoglycan-binding domain-containing protein [Aurantivibrio plasticivorans]